MNLIAGTEPPPAPRKPRVKPPRTGGWKRKYQALLEETQALRTRLELTAPQTLELWDILPQELRDDMAVRAIFQEQANSVRALIYLGFDVPERGKDRKGLREMIDRVFNTPGVKERLARNFQNADAERSAIVARQVEIAERGDPEQSIKATTVIARLQGWLTKDAPPPGIGPPIQILNVIGALKGNGQAELAAAPEAASSSVFDVLGHTPGAAMRIDSGDPEILAALQEADEEEAVVGEVLDPADMQEMGIE